MSANPHIGSSFEAFLKEEGLYDEITAHAIARIQAWLQTESSFSEHTEPQSDPGWAEAVATPDEDVNYVFTWLSANFTNLSVDISVGDDTPLVIACPRDLNAETIAAIRHWVVRNKDALTDHWQNRIGSAELVSQLKPV
jgi:hypothetical protein